MQTSVTGIDAPLAIQGRCPGVKSRFVAVAMLAEEIRGTCSDLIVRIDDRLNPGFWCEVTIKPDQLLSLICEQGNVHASDFRYDD